MTEEMMKWDFQLIKTDNGVFQTTAYGLCACGYNYVVLVEKEIGKDIFVGLYGYGNTKEEAMKEAKEKARNAD